MFHFGRLKQNRVLTIAAAAGLGLAYGTAAPARATVIIEDHFTLGDPADNGQPTRFSSGNGGDAGGGLGADTASPAGAIWMGVAQADGYNTAEYTSSAIGSEFTNGSVSQAQAYNGNGGAMTLGGSTAAELEITMTFADSATAASVPDTVLGFYSSVPTAEYSSGADSNFAGLMIDSSGNLYTDVNGTDSAPVAYNGTYTLGNLYTLTYDLNTITGLLSNISLSGSTADYSALLTLGPVTANYAGFAVFQNNSGVNATFFEVSTPSSVPEPASIGLLLSCSMLLARRRRRA